MKLNQKEQEVMDILRNISGESNERIQNVLLAIMIYSFLNYSTGEDTLLPYFGKFMFYGDENYGNPKDIDIKGFFVPSDFIKQNIAMYKELEKGKTTVDQIPIFKYFKSDNERTLRAILNDEEINN